MSHLTISARTARGDPMPIGLEIDLNFTFLGTLSLALKTLPNHIVTHSNFNPHRSESEGNVIFDDEIAIEQAEEWVPQESPSSCGRARSRC